ncbi:YheC/YheD family protein [Paenibacillus physcomitrellae]|uniref:Endospore coat-associated protein YheC n=1 Tax=Paenibacillus physcomitrellae TaxID=1619311 RepID=A0ABQ1GYV5_9BACL|nr:YheC/YheD family protein [Paenibacillus physcomitrellae]GGA52692.1 endospore coat-associated protein YheC [Paenibacillus physcomitrellae]
MESGKQAKSQAQPKRTGTLGILVAATPDGPAPFAESGFARKLCLAASGHGLTAYAFTPRAETDEDQITGYTFRDGSWVNRKFPLPDVVYDRFFSSGTQKWEKRRQLAALAEKHRFRLLGRGTAGKWIVYEALKQNQEIAPYLPETFKYENFRQLKELLNRWQGEIFLKPQFGTHGKLALHLKERQFGERRVYLLSGRDISNEVFQHRFHSGRDTARYIESLRRGKPFLAQPKLRLSTRSGEPFDIRVLMQKGKEGQWSMTGMAARVGKAGSLTSNLHGGGKACRADQLLSREFGPTAARSIIANLRQLSAVIPPYLEERFGRLAELGLDFGIDSEARIWLLEVNSKPGRSAFFGIGDSSGARKAVENPVLYACYLLKQPETS